MSIQKSQLRGSLILNQKVGPVRIFDKNVLINVAISLGYYPKDFKFSGYEGLIYGKIRHREPKTKMKCSELQWILISHLSYFMLILDDEISV